MGQDTRVGVELIVNISCPYDIPKSTSRDHYSDTAHHDYYLRQDLSPAWS